MVKSDSGAKQAPELMPEEVTPVKPQLVDTYIADVAGNISIVKTPKGQKYQAGEPLGPFGSRVASERQIAAYQAAQGK